MARVVVIGIPGEDGLWMADLDNGTVTAVDAELAAELVGGMDAAEPTVKGVKVAVAISSGREVASSVFEG